MGPWGGFLTGLSENVEYVLTPAVIVFFIGSYMGGIVGTPAEYQPLWWIGFYLVFVALNIVGVELSFKVTVLVTLAALACLVVFWISAIPHHGLRQIRHERRSADGSRTGRGRRCLPAERIQLASWPAMPFAVWLFLAIEQLPLAAEESVDPQTRHVRRASSSACSP